MYSQERKTRIMDLLEAQSSVNVNALAEMLHTSRETIRRDLKELETEGMLKRTHGGAVTNTGKTSSTATRLGDTILSNEYPFALRHVRNIPEKRAIAKKAASFIKDRDTIFIDNSSTTLFLLEYIPRNLRLTVITNSIKVLLDAAKLGNPNLSLISLAGFYNCENYSLYGSRTIKSAEDFFPNKCFISCTGVTLANKLTDISLNEIDTKTAMIDKSEEAFLLADHTKFQINGPFFLSGFNVIDYIITDQYDYTSETAGNIRTITSENNIRIITT